MFEKIELSGIRIHTWFQIHPFFPCNPMIFIIFAGISQHQSGRFQTSTSIEISQLDLSRHVEQLMKFSNQQKYYQLGHLMISSTLTLEMFTSFWPKLCKYRIKITTKEICYKIRQMTAVAAYSHCIFQQFDEIFEKNPYFILVWKVCQNEVSAAWIGTCMFQIDEFFAFIFNKDELQTLCLEPE